MATQPDVVFVVIDSVRKDRCSLYGHDVETTPRLTALAEDSLVFENAYTAAPWTLPSHSSMFTGLFPSEHGVTNGFADSAFGLPRSYPTLAEELSAAGYRTGGFSNNPWVGQLSGLDRGFDEFVEWDLEISHTRGGSLHDRRAKLLSRGHSVLGQLARTPVYVLKRRFFTDRLASRAERWIRGDGVSGDPGSARADPWRTDDRPAFTFCNFMEAHSPYYPPREAFRALDLPTPDPIEPRRLNLRLTAYVLGRTDLGGNAKRLREYYDASVRYQDGKVGDLVDALKDAGRYDDALIVVCADHGKTLGEFPRSGSPPHYLREINANVPLVVKPPGGADGRRVAEPFELPRLFDLMREAGTATTEDRSVESLLDGREYALVEDFIPHTGKEASAITRWRAITDGDEKLIESEDGERFVLAGDGVDEAVVDAATDRTRRLRRELDARVDALVPDEAGEDDRGESADMDSTVTSQLEDLGYL